jgi:hypothetical protein
MGPRWGLDGLDAEVSEGHPISGSLRWLILLLAIKATMHHILLICFSGSSYAYMEYLRRLFLIACEVRELLLEDIVGEAGHKATIQYKMQSPYRWSNGGGE